MRRGILFLVCCLGILGAYLIVNHAQTPRDRPVLVVKNNPKGVRSEADILAACPTVALGYTYHVERTNPYYTL